MSLVGDVEEVDVVVVVDDICDGGATFVVELGRLLKKC
jgi:phosphoribosylpyrophosphate synthetase